MRVKIGYLHIDLNEVALIDEEDEFKLIFYLKSGAKIIKDIPKIDPYKNLKFRIIVNNKDVKKDEIVINSQKDGYRAYLKKEVMEVLDKEKLKWDSMKKEIFKKWGEM